MEVETNSKFKIYLVITIFIMIILLSAYVVTNKIINHQTIMNYESIDFEKQNDLILQNSSSIIELDFQNEKVNRMYNLINTNLMDERLYLMKQKDFDWANTSAVVLSLVEENSIIYDSGKKYIDSEGFDLKYNELFGKYKIGLEKTSDSCNSVSFDIASNRYLINESCKEDNLEIKTFLKNITYDETTEEIKINKYYTFVKETDRINFYTDYEGVDLFYENDLKKIIAVDIKREDINNYIFNMNVISYVFKKNVSGEYYLASVK